MISERTLRNWRRDALKESISLAIISSPIAKELTMRDERILRLTQELMDLYLVKKG
jgi:hypothetical protein